MRIKPRQATIDLIVGKISLLNRDTAEQKFNAQKAENVKFLRGEPNNFKRDFGEVRPIEAWVKDFQTQNNAGHEQIALEADAATDDCNAIVTRAIDYCTDLADRIADADLARCREFGVAEFPSQVALGLRALARALTGRIQKGKGHAQWPRHLLAGIYDI